MKFKAVDIAGMHLDDKSTNTGREEFVFKLFQDAKDMDGEMKLKNRVKTT